MNAFKSLAIVPAVVLLASAPAFSQDTRQEAPPRAYLSLTGGAAFTLEFDRPTATFAGEYGERINDDVQAYVNLSYVDNLMSDRMRQNLVVAGQTLTALDGVLWQFDGKDRGLAFTVGGKFLAPIGSRIRPYVGGGVGLLNLKRRITERDFGEMTEDYLLLVDAGLPVQYVNDGVMKAGETSATKPLAEIIVGAGGAIGRAYLDVSYRYRKAFHSFEDIDFGQVTVGVGMAWK